METDLQNLQQNHSNTQKHHKLSWKLVRHEILLASTSMAPPMALQSPTTPSYLDYKFVGPSRNNVYILKKKYCGAFLPHKVCVFQGMDFGCLFGSLRSEINLLLSTEEHIREIM